MQLESQRTGLRPDELEFSLGEIQRNTISNNKIVAQLDYSLKNQSTITVPSNTSTVTPGSEIVFSFDKSYLANNSYLNRCKMRGEFAVRLPLEDLNGDPTAPAEYNTGAGPAIGQRTTQVNNHGWDPSSMALAPFVLNKALSRREIDFSGKSIQTQTFSDQHDIDELACMYNQDTLEIMGIYPDTIRGLSGEVSDVYGSGPGLPAFYDGAQSATIDYSNKYEYLNNQAFYKRNQNGKYYYTKSNTYYTSANVVVGGCTYEKAGGSIALSRVNITGAVNISGEGSNQQSLDYNPRLDLTPAGVTAIASGGYQVIVFAVEEDLISDIFTNIYVDTPRYYAMNSAELNFRFEQSGNLNSLFKTRTPQLGGGSPTVTMTKLDLEFITFNLGTIQIPFDTFEVPFFLQVANRQNKQLSANSNGKVDIEVPVIAYSTVPHYIKIDLFQASEATDWQKLTKLLSISGLKLKIDQDVGNALQQMSIHDLYMRTLKNLGMWRQSFDRVYRHMVAEANTSPQYAGASLASNYLTAESYSHPQAESSSAPIIPFLLLKVGSDIRLQPGLEAGMRERINMTFTVSGDHIWCGGTLDVTTKITAYTCGKYIISPLNGLLDTVEVSYSRNEWVDRITTMNNELEDAKSSGKIEKWHQQYTIPQSMVLGGSWFSGLAKAVGPVLSTVKRIARKVADVADSDIARDLFPSSSNLVSQVGRKTHDVLDTMGMGKTRRIKYV